MTLTPQSGLVVSGATITGRASAPGTVTATITEFYTTVNWPRGTTLADRDRVLPLDDFVRLVVAGTIIAVTGPDGPTFTDAGALDMLAEGATEAERGC